MIWTICFLVKENQVCLAMKKRGHGAGRWNGTGGKPQEGESFGAATKRETEEEIGVKLLDIEKVAEIEFKDLPTKSSHFATAFISKKWEGEPKETEEMRPQWFLFNKIPYDHMWSADKVWIPKVLNGERIKAIFEYSEGDKLVDFSITNL